MSYEVLANTSNHNFQVSSRPDFSLLLVSYCPCIIHSHEHSGLDSKHLFLVVLMVRSLKWVLSGYNQCVSRTVFHLGGPRAEPVFLPFPVSGGCLHSLALDPLLSPRPATCDRVLHTVSF